MATILFLARLIDHEETWKYTNGTGWCYLDVWIIYEEIITNHKTFLYSSTTLMRFYNS